MESLEEFIRVNEKMNSSLITDWSREMLIDAIKIWAEKQNKINNDGLDFGRYVSIEMYRFYGGNEFYKHKVVNRLQSNTYVEVPVKGVKKETFHPEMEDVVSCICCGVDETEVLKYRVKDVRIIFKT